MLTDEQCKGCEHPVSRHYKAADDTQRCLYHESGLSTSGVIGLPWSRDCDCINGKSKAADYQRGQQRREDEERDRVIDKIMEGAKDARTYQSKRQAMTDEQLKEIQEGYEAAVLRCKATGEMLSRAWSGVGTLLTHVSAHKAQQEKLVGALEEIANHPHNSYEVSSIEVADGHRCAANIARTALSQARGEGEKQ